MKGKTVLLPIFWGAFAGLVIYFFLQEQAERCGIKVIQKSHNKASSAGK